MKFSEFLRDHRTKLGFASVTQLFENWGGEKSLQVSLRSLQLIEAGKLVPSLKTFAAIFRHLERQDFKVALQSYFEDCLDPKLDQDLLAYMEDHLTPAFNKTEKSVWDTNVRQIFYSEGQMQFLIHDVEAMKLHHQLLLFDRLKPEEYRGREASAKLLVNHGLATMEKTGLNSIRALIRTPNYENSSAAAVRLATRMILKHHDAYLSEEGGPNQGMYYAIQLVDKTMVKPILDEMNKFKKWVQSLSTQKTDSSVTPFVMVGFGKGLEKKDFR